MTSSLIFRPRSRGMLVLLISLCLVFAVLPSGVARAEGRGFTSLEEAAKAGLIDPVVVKQVQAGKKITVIAQLDPADVLKAYGTGDERGVAAATEANARMRTDVTKATGIKPLDYYQLVPALVYELSDVDLTLRLINNWRIMTIGQNRANELHLGSSLRTIRQPQTVQAAGLDGSGTAVAVLDTGADFTDQDFGSCTAPGTPATCRIPAVVEAAPNDNSRDDHGHGTNVSGIVAGVAPGAKVIPIDVFASGFVFDRWGLAGMSWVLGHSYQFHIAAINMSWGYPEHLTSPCDGAYYDNTYSSTFQLLRQANVLPVASSGNSGFVNGRFVTGVGAPACAAGVVAVGAVYTNTSATTAMAWSGCVDQPPVMSDQVTCFSSAGPMVDILAPGTEIDAAGREMSGTSQASPHVAAAAAILRQAAPSLSITAREQALTTSNVRITDPRTGITHPRLDLPSAVAAASPAANDNRAARTVLGGFSGRLDQTTWAATREAGETTHAGDPGGASVWFEWVPAYATTAVFSTQDSDFDTLLSVYSVAANGTLTTLAENDDENMGITTSSVSVPVAAGQRIQIAVDGKRLQAVNAASSGHLHLTWNLPNDNLADAIAFPATINAIGAIRTGSNIGATRQAGEPVHCGDVYANASVWYKWTPAFDQRIRIRQAGTRATCLAVYRAPASSTPPTFGQLTRVLNASDDQGDPIDVSFDAVLGDTYWLAMDGVSNEVACYPNGMCDFATSQVPFLLQFN